MASGCREPPARRELRLSHGCLALLRCGAAAMAVCASCSIALLVEPVWRGLAGPDPVPLDVLVALWGAACGPGAWAYLRGDRLGAMATACWLAASGVALGLPVLTGGGGASSAIPRAFSCAVALACASALWRQGCTRDRAGPAGMLQGATSVAVGAMAACGLLGLTGVVLAWRGAVGESGWWPSWESVARGVYSLSGLVLAAACVRRVPVCGHFAATWWGLTAILVVTSGAGPYVRAAGVVVSAAAAAAGSRCLGRTSPMSACD